MKGRFQIMASRKEVCTLCGKRLKYRIQYYSYMEGCKQHWVCNDCVCEILKKVLEETYEG